MKYNTQQYAITIKRDLAAVLGVAIQDIADTVSVMMSGNHWTDVQAGNKTYEVIVQMRKDDLSNFNALKKLYVRSNSRSSSSRNKENMIPVSSLINLIPAIGQGNFTHYDRFRSGTISARLSSGYSESQIINYIKVHLPSVLTSNVHAVFSGKAAQFLESSKNIASIVVMSLIFIYLLLSVQFGSFIDPLIILLTVPLSIIGGLFSLKLSGGTLNIYSQIGLVTLISMITKYGILITQFINDLRKKSISTQDAIIRGAMIRLRPILMTTMAMVFGALPLVLSTGSGSISRHQIGWVIIEGLLFGTFFSLIVVSITYLYFVRFKKSLISSVSTN
ncbi:efflux RND transporter permease subunit [Coxiella endosymbiont of Dermacentor marginatus]|uniref:efflux RND transporter permease subunit n=1 Tax=Coxiella endosymbiont of Dermacentor marginatus TaxID=1656159 RepID=UPI0022236A55|nr:efflux RND transporter permease subunit [Coxiella endosymbiont of Dermacentor marginatus]